MSEKQNGVTIKLEKKVHRLLEKEAKKDGLTVAQEVELAMLYCIRKYDIEFLEKIKQKASPAVLRVFERETA